MSIHRNARTALIAAALATVVVAAACKKQSAAGPALPASTEVTGWARTSDVRTFTPSNLYEYIDGDAERYIKAGLKSTSTAEYKFQDKIEAVADVYTMANSDGARAIFESQPAGKAKSVPLGDAARASAQSLVFRKGPHLVRLVAYQDVPETEQALINLGRSIEGKLSK